MTFEQSCTPVEGKALPRAPEHNEADLSTEAMSKRKLGAQLAPEPSSTEVCPCPTCIRQPTPETPNPTSLCSEHARFDPQVPT